MSFDNNNNDDYDLLIINISAVINDIIKWSRKISRRRLFRSLDDYSILIGDVTAVAAMIISINN